MRRNLGLDQPLHIQYFRWLASFLQGNFGYSFGQMRPIADILPEVLWNTVQLMLATREDIFAGYSEEAFTRAIAAAPASNSVTAWSSG